MATKAKWKEVTVDVGTWECDQCHEMGKCKSCGGTTARAIYQLGKKDVVLCKDCIDLTMKEYWEK
jgi:hypothetical protein